MQDHAWCTNVHLCYEKLIETTDVLHLRKGLLVDEMVGLGQEWHVDGEEVGLPEDRVHVHVAAVLNGLDPLVVGVDVEAEDPLHEPAYLLGRLTACVR